MALGSPSDPSPGEESVTKGAACLSCRRSKSKCCREEHASVCARCQRNGVDCIVPTYRVGRHKGVKNKRTGLEKAIHQVQEAIQKSQTLHLSPITTPNSVALQQLLRSTNSVESNVPLEALVNESANSVQNQGPHHASGRASMFEEPLPSSEAAHLQLPSRTTGNGDLADAENPLQLLAQASEVREAHNQAKEVLSHSTGSPVVHYSNRVSFTEKGDDIDHFFGRFRPELDVGSDLDPVENGLITVSEAESMFEFFFQNLAHTRWGIDPEIHTIDFVRSRSAFLFTSICAASALFLPSAAALSKRLSIHCRKLAHSIIPQRRRSVEIVLAFMVNIPWMSPGDHWADDETCVYLSMALTIAMDLSLHKIVGLRQEPYQRTHRGDIASTDFIDTRKALDLDGFEDIQPTSLWGRRLLRRRERTWLALFVLERGVCLARGRKYTLPMTPLVKTCDEWHLSEIADARDGSIVSVAVLRREFASLVEKVQTICDEHQMERDSGSEAMASINGVIEGFFYQWYHTWSFQVSDRTESRLPPYVEILASHTRLSLYSSVINHSTAPIEVKRFFRSSGLASALNVMRAAVQGETQLKSMPNNTAIMISFAACFALELSAILDENRASLAPSVRNLIAETADVLERIGATPPHRKGASTLFARQLRKIAGINFPSDNNESQNAQVDVGSFAAVSQGPVTYEAGHTYSAATFAPSEPLMFSGMSNDEIVDAINSAGVALDVSWTDFQFFDGTNLDWMDWPN